MSDRPALRQDRRLDPDEDRGGDPRQASGHSDLSLRRRPRLRLGPSSGLPPRQRQAGAAADAEAVRQARRRRRGLAPYSSSSLLTMGSRWMRWVITAWTMSRPIPAPKP